MPRQTCVSLAGGALQKLVASRTLAVDPPRFSTSGEAPKAESKHVRVSDV